jgi:hypothetical protein
MDDDLYDIVNDAVTKVLDRHCRVRGFANWAGAWWYVLPQIRPAGEDDDVSADDS